MIAALLEVKEPFLKRPFDVVLASMGLALSAPLWVAISVSIYLQDRGPVYFVQERCGRFGERYGHIKFRTMSVPPRGERWHQVIYLRNDPRVTKVGRLLRATALDELPELVNILRGDMSFVGPRPLPYRIDMSSPYRSIAEVPGYDVRSRVRPGLTGLAQTCARKDIDHRNKFRYDNVYVSRMSLWLDLRLLALSLWVTLWGGWERTGKKT